MKLTIVINKKNNKLVPFRYLPNGEIQIISTASYESDQLIVTTINHTDIGKYLPDNLVAFVPR